MVHATTMSDIMSRALDCTTNIDRASFGSFGGRGIGGSHQISVILLRPKLCRPDVKIRSPFGICVSRTIPFSNWVHGIAFPLPDGSVMIAEVPTWSFSLHSK